MLSIGDLSRRTGVKVPTIRYYEQMGLLQAEGRTDGNQRRYSHAGLERLAFIRHARDLGLPIGAIRELIALDGSDCEKAHPIATLHLLDIRRRIEALRGLEAELARIAAACDGSAGACRTLAAFGDHGKCARDHSHP
ncbi:helix-turn-helix domain-containing protein [Frigidibacter sp. RF13]|uniref:MerR family transcriptional regulator n=1 Tax=Frigidibacter sp. RF13 TaxID=2997340 RepID=UPI00226FB9DB|nr:helix-turn-helix domain-containing protein [Frigidibacter sp. RF13]MCY1126848.1 helix-turn-helix domain-containing protein [Frigidibacter sp. RF13]